jgi:hypothetical protein
LVDKEHILSEIRRTAEENGGKPLGRARFFKDTGIRESDWAGRYWARWSDAVQEAGLTPNQMKVRSDDLANMDRLAQETRRLGHLPTGRELRLRRQRDASFPSVGVFDRLGSKQMLAVSLAEYCEQQPDYADVLEIVRPLLETKEEKLDSMPTESPAHGFVYLLKAGSHYKLGRTNSVGRREYELGIQLPERAVKVHEIKTDDPVGIEGYWHRRFADHRANGEWFELTPADVSAFRRRKFM